MLNSFLLQKDHINASALIKIHKKNLKEKNDSRYERYQTALKLSRPVFRKLRQTTSSEDKAFAVNKGMICLGNANQASQEELQILQTAFKQMMPWRKGPFDVYGLLVDAEWCSNLKWDRVRKVAGSLQGKVVLDVGCNNGYYLYQIAKQKPKYLLGIDPVVPYYYQYQLLKEAHALPNTDFLLAGVHDVIHLPKTFDVIFCMGILYHHPDPLSILKIMFQALRPGGLLIVESLGINKQGSYFLFPESRYMNMPGHWFIPTQEALENMVRRSGFQYVDTFFQTALSREEQRKTNWCHVDSLIEGMDAENSNKTVEGYEEPWRYYLKARRARVRR